MKFAGRTALITGGVSGIGFGIARAFCTAGIELILTYRDEDLRSEAAQWFRDYGHPAPRFARLDVTDRRAWAQLADAAGAVHILVNNAGVSVFGPTDEARYADYDWIMGVNFGGAVNGLVTFIPKMKAQGTVGHIVNVASMAAYLSGPQAGIYTASKFALRGLTESLRYNLAPYGIGVSLMCPGLTKTHAWNSALKRPVSFAESGFAVGMDPLEVGNKTLAGMIENRAVIFTHPEFAEDFAEIYQASIAALPQEPVPEGRLQIERLRRAANRAAAAGKRIDLGDLT
jgi:NAD(P)-dependent dehydrogenase (short-subunit alcohol dehydrogenase family)